MIKTLRGIILKVAKQELVLEIGSVGLGVLVTTKTLQTKKVGEPLFLYTSFVVREDSLKLYGFEHEDERDIFELLLSVSGIGPRLGLAILSTLNPDTVRRAVVQSQPEVFSQVSGVGKKTAQRIILQLEDKLDAVDGLEPISIFSEVDTEVVEALIALGYSVVEAQTAVQSLPKDIPENVEARLSAALAYFS